MKKITLKKIKFKLRYLRAKLLRGFDIKFKTKYGFSLWLDLRRDVDFLLYRGEFEKSHLDVFFSLIHMNDTVIDVGANIGIYSMLASTKVAASGNVFAFEPSEWARERLEKNLVLNNVHNVTIIPKGVSNKSGKIDFYICEDDAYNSIGNVPMKPVIKKEVIDVITLDDFCTEQGITKVDILKIDTEGADYLVLQGATTILNSNSPPILFCEVNKNIKEGFNFTLEVYLNFFNKHGYDVFEIDKNTKKLCKYNLKESNSSEIICLKEYHRKRYADILVIHE